MQYAKIKIPGGFKLTYQQIGEELQNTLEKLGYKVKLPTSADCGYLFRTKANGHTLDISVVPLSEDILGLAIEHEKRLRSATNKHFNPKDIKVVKEWIEDILALDIAVTGLKWFTADEWVAAFGVDFWHHSANTQFKKI